MSSLSAKLIDGVEPLPGSISWQRALCVCLSMTLCGCEVRRERTGFLIRFEAGNFNCTNVLLKGYSMVWERS